MEDALAYVNLEPAHHAYKRHLFDVNARSGVDVFFHSWCPSAAVQAKLLSLWSPVAHQFDNNTEVRQCQ